MKRTIAMLRDDYASKLPGKIAEIEELRRRLLAADAPVAELQDVVRMVHGIADSGATFGLAVASDAARELARFLNPIHAAGRLPDAAERTRVAALIAALKQAATSRAPGFTRLSFSLADPRAGQIRAPLTGLCAPAHRRPSERP